MELTDIMPLESWKSIADHLYDKFGFNGVVYKTDNFILAKSDGWANKVCPAIKAGDSVVVCSSAQQRIAKMVQEKKDCVIDECDAGFIKFLMPLYVRDEFTGMIGGCGCLAESTSIDAFHLSKLLKREDIADIIDTTKNIPGNALAEAIQFVRQKADRLATA